MKILKIVLAISVIFLIIFGVILRLERSKKIMLKGKEEEEEYLYWA